MQDGMQGSRPLALERLQTLAPLHKKSIQVNMRIIQDANARQQATRPHALKYLFHRAQQMTLVDAGGQQEQTPRKVMQTPRANTKGGDTDTKGRHQGRSCRPPRADIKSKHQGR
eukprot:1159550-Pelagomonas_calceolata.AAC.6